MSRRTLTATRPDAHSRLDRFLARAVAGLTLEQASALADGGKVRIRGKIARAGRVLWGNEVVEVELEPPPPVVAAADAPEIPVLHADADILVVDKPPGLVVESEGKGRSVVEIVGARVGGCEVARQAVPGVAHRLDRETSGCLALARSDAALAALKRSFEQKLVQKRYLALVLGEPPDKLRLEGPYGRDPKDPRRYTTRFASPRRAALFFEVRERFPGAALLEVGLETGRTHQIRVQLSEAGYLVLGDKVYGTDAARAHPAARAIGRQALHAVTLSLPGVSARAPVPKDFERAMELLREGRPG